jgi:intracellular multiplication protein IcmO
MASSSRYKGVSRNQEVKVDQRRVDTRRWAEVVKDEAGTPSGTITIFAVMLFGCALLCWLPFAAELIFIFALLFYRKHYNYRNRIWSAPFRVPAYLKALTGRDFLDETTNKPGSGDIYLGFDLETNREVWGSLDDARTHRLVAGTTGSGKTEELLAETFNALAHDSGVMMIDGKGEMKGSLKGVTVLARLFWRDEDIFSLNYVMGGSDAQLFRSEKRSNTFNPLQNMGSAAMTEILISLLSSSGGEGQMWQDRAISLLQGIIPPLNYLSMQGYIIFNAETLSNFFPLNAIEDLYWHHSFIDHNGHEVTLPEKEAAFIKREYFGALKIYLQNLPGYTVGPPKPFMGRPGHPPAPQGDESRAEALKQHGFLTMQVVKPITDLSFNYGHIYNVTIGEIDFKDIAQNRRIMVALLPAMERSKANMQPLGKMAVAAIKNTLATGLSGPVSGEWREVMASQEVSRGPSPYFVLCDEYGYFVVEGFAVAPAQARSLGYAITFGVQNIDNLMEASENEGKATQENTNITLVGRMTGGSESATFKFAEGRAGQAYVQLQEDLEMSMTSFGTQRLDETRSRLQAQARVHFDDMAAQKDGKFTLIIGTPTFSRKGKKVVTDQTTRVVRMLSFYCGGDYAPDTVQPVDTAYVLPLSPDERQRMRAELTLKGNSDLALKIGETARSIMAGLVDRVAFELDAGSGEVTYVADDYITYLMMRLRKYQRGVGSLEEFEKGYFWKGYVNLTTSLEAGDREADLVRQVQKNVADRVEAGPYRSMLNDVVVDFQRARLDKQREQVEKTTEVVEGVSQAVEKAAETVTVKRVRRPARSVNA